METFQPSKGGRPEVEGAPTGLRSERPAMNPRGAGLYGQARTRANLTFYSKYEENSSVDPVNGRPNLYDWPPFMKDPAS
jgi:hypothetical protein